MNYASVREPKLRSPLLEAMQLRPQRKKMKKSTVVGLVLTSLVDAFSILLLYLLFQQSGVDSTFEFKTKTANLPVAVKAEGLHSGTLVRVENGRYFLGDEPLDLRTLASRLQKIKAELGEDVSASALIIQADRGIDFSDLTPIIRAGSISGFNKFKFAVQQAEGT